MHPCEGSALLRACAAASGTCRCCRCSALQWRPQPLGLLPLRASPGHSTARRVLPLTPACVGQDSLVPPEQIFEARSDTDLLEDVMRNHMRRKRVHELPLASPDIYQAAQQVLPAAQGGLRCSGCRPRCLAAQALAGCHADTPDTNPPPRPAHVRACSGRTRRRCGTRTRSCRAPSRQSSSPQRLSGPAARRQPRQALQHLRTLLLLRTLLRLAQPLRRRLQAAPRPSSLQTVSPAWQCLALQGMAWPVHSCRGPQSQASWPRQCCTESGGAGVTGVNFLWLDVPARPCYLSGEQAACSRQQGGCASRAQRSTCCRRWARAAGRCHAGCRTGIGRACATARHQRCRPTG